MEVIIINSDFNNNLKRMMQFQKRISKIYEPVWIENQNWIQQLNANAELFNNAMTDQIVAIEHSFSPIVEMLTSQKAFIEQISINRTHFDNIQHLHANLEHLINSQSINLHELIPDFLYDSLLDLDEEIAKTLKYQDGYSEVQVEFTIKDLSNSTIGKKKLDWGSFIQILLISIQILMQYQDGVAEQKRHEERMAAEKLHHQEIMTEEQLQTELLRRSVEIQEQNLIESQLQTEASQVTEKQYEIINEKIDLLIKKSLDSIIENPTDQVEDSNE